MTSKNHPKINKTTEPTNHRNFIIFFMFFSCFATCQNPCFHWQGQYFRGFVPFNNLQKTPSGIIQKIIPKSLKNQPKIISKSTPKLDHHFHQFFARKTAARAPILRAKYLQKLIQKHTPNFIDFYIDFGRLFGSLLARFGLQNCSQNRSKPPLGHREAPKACPGSRRPPKASQNEAQTMP